LSLLFLFFPSFQYSNFPLLLLLRRHSQVAKAAVCKTVIHRFESDCRLQQKQGLSLYWLVPFHLWLRIGFVSFSRLPSGCVRGFSSYSFSGLKMTSLIEPTAAFPDYPCLASSLIPQLLRLSCWLQLWAKSCSAPLAPELALLITLSPRLAR
jgi:hypothetical protein